MLETRSAEKGDQADLKTQDPTRAPELTNVEKGATENQLTDVPPDGGLAAWSVIFGVRRSRSPGACSPADDANSSIVCLWRLLYCELGTFAFPCRI